MKSSVSTEPLCRAVLDALRERFGGDLVSVALFGSRARENDRPDSDATAAAGLARSVYRIVRTELSGGS